MSGELFGNGLTHDAINLANQVNISSSDPGKVETEVSGVFADGKKDEFPVFTVSSEDFYNNMKADRKRLRFSTDSVSQYLRGSKYNRPFYIQFKGENGENFLRKVK